MLASLFLCLKFVFDLFGAVYRDLLGIKIVINLKRTLNELFKTKTNTYERFSKIVKKNPNKPCIIFNDEIWTFQQVIDIMLIF